MPVTFWVDEEKDDLFYWKFKGQWTVEGFLKVNAKAGEMVIERSPKPVYAIADLTESAPPPMGFVLMMRNLQTDDPPENWRLTVLVVDSVLFRGMLHVASRMTRTFSERFAVVQTMPEAERMIKSLRAEHKAEAAVASDERASTP